ncbi:peptide deformylase [Oceanomicrobium pacificus]|uniref:Peptide deformylase-like n=1 Tax=Oceanomicrobium pacificus TaxID=2692916 RepID=A0A6B0TSJ5_9RHOB|nr:peptide deformylase [Oceanomicrobium pacificus]MXU63973.1 peptide deformylase [Oceanomicrobium pacificus]
MAVRPFLIYPDKRLRSVCVPVDAVDDAVRAVWQDMLDSMYAMPGVGLAANQIGVMQRLAVVDCSEAQDAPVRMANPEILHASVKLRAHQEGSPNIPGLWAEVERPRAVTVAYLDETGTRVERDFVNLWATSVQHQIDHLNGKLFIDHLKPVKRKMLLARHAKLQKRKGG